MSLLTAYDKFIQQALKYGFSLYGTPPTGQTVVYDPGDDGTTQKGYPRTGPRFTDNGDGTVTDNATGLMWAQDADEAGCNMGTPKRWEDAIMWSIPLNFAGHSDWRIPNIFELNSIYDMSKANPAIDTAIFPNTGPDNYWSSTTYHSVTANAWMVLGSAGATANAHKDLERWVRVVRGGVPL